MVWHLGRKSLQFQHALRLQVFDCIIVLSIFGLWRWPRHKDMLQHLEHKSRFPVKGRSGKDDQELKNTLPYYGVLGKSEHAMKEDPTWN